LASIYSQNTEQLGIDPHQYGAGALEANSKSNANYKYKYGSKTHSAEQLTKLDKARMEKIAKVTKRAGKSLTYVFGRSYSS